MTLTMARTPPHLLGPFLAAPVCCGDISRPRSWLFGLFVRSAVGVVDRVEGLDPPLPTPSLASGPRPTEIFRGQVSHKM